MSTEQESVQRLAEIRERAEKATPGPWEFEHEDYVSSMYFGSANAGAYPAQRAPIHRDTDFTDQQADEARSTIEFIAHSREDVPYLLSLIDSLTAERDNAVWRADRLDDAGRVQQSRAEAVEADRERLREALDGLVVARDDVMVHPVNEDEVGATRRFQEAMTVARAALASTERSEATPPSEEGTK